MQPRPNQSPQSKSRSYFWPGFALGFLLLAMLSCGGIFMLSGLRSLSLANLQPGAAWTPPPVTATPVAVQPTPQTASPTGGALYAPGDDVVNVATSRVNIRRTPGYLGKTADDVIAQMQPGDMLQIVQGPVSADNLQWWRVIYTRPENASVEGWVAEATASGVTILAEP